MTVVDPSHPKAQMALTTEGQSTSGEDVLPSYTPSASGSRSTAPLISEEDPLAMSRHSPTASSSRATVDPPAAPFDAESVADLNPEMRKKLADDIRDRDADALDFGFRSPGTHLPSFAETDISDRPEYTIDRDGNITTHDAKLNSKASSLLRFLRLHAASPPTFSIHLRGSHVETREVTTWEVGKHGRRHEKRSTQRDEVEDFNTFIEASSEVAQGMGSARGVGGGMRGLLYAVGPWEVVHRGGAFKTREWTPLEKARSTGTIRLEDDQDEESHVGLGKQVQRQQWRHAGLGARRKMGRERREREKRGLPLFVDPASLVDIEEDSRPSHAQAEHPALLYKSHWVDLVETHSTVALDMTATGAGSRLPSEYDVLVDERERRNDEVQRIVEEYCACTSKLKELRIEKELYGWRLDLLEAGLRSIIQRTGYSGTIQIAFKTAPLYITIRPDNFLSRVFSLHWAIKALLWLVLVYPIFLLVDVFAGRKFYNLRAAYPLTRWRRLPTPAASSTSTSTAATVTTYAEALHLATQFSSRQPPKIAQLPLPSLSDAAAQSRQPWLYLVGQQEGEWLRSWEDLIVDGVRRGVRGRGLGEEDRARFEQEQRRNMERLRGYTAD